MKFNPRELIIKNHINIELKFDGKILASKDIWPENLIYDPYLSDKDENIDQFYEYMWSDTTLTFYIESAINRVRSLISRAAFDGKNNLIKHSDVHIIFLDDKPEDFDKPNWMTKTKTIIYFKEINK
jgi:hypothetical protein